MARRLFVVLVSICTLAVVAGPTQAQPGEITVTLVDQPIWHEPGDRLGLEVLLSNPGPTSVSGYVVTVAVHSRVLSRSELHESFTDPTFQTSLITAIDAPEDEIAPGEKVRLEIDQPVSDLQSLTLASESGVYPLEISVFDPAGAALASTSTPLIYYPSPPEFRLPTVPIVPVSEVPQRGPDGIFAATDGRVAIEESLEPRGWLAGLLRSLDEATTPPPEVETERRGRGRGRDRARRRPAPKPEPGPLHVGVAIMPRLAEELEDMADGYRRQDDEQAGPGSESATQAAGALDSLRRIVERPSAQPILSPYSFPDLPTTFAGLTDSIASEHLKRQLEESEAILGGVLGQVPTRRWLYAPAGRLDHIALEELQRLDAARYTFFAEESLEPLVNPEGGGCPEAPLSFTCPVSVTTSAGLSTGYVFDRALQQRSGEVADPGSGRRELQRLFAETAMIREEVPSRTDRVIALGLPTRWTPNPRLSQMLFDGLRRAPWLQTMTPREGLETLAEQIDPIERRVRSVVSPLDEPTADHFDEIEDADEVIEGFRSVQPPPELIERLTRNVLVSDSRLWSGDPALVVQGERYADEAADEAERELDKITVGGNDEIALTSRQAEIPVVVFNDAAYDASVTVRITSADLRLDETFSITVQARGLRVLNVDVAAQSSGIFGVDVIVETPNGLLIDRNAVRVRSTEFNEIALGLTFGALAFLVLFYVTRAIRSRKAPSEGSAT